MTYSSAPSIRRLRKKYGQDFHFVAVYILEVHPKGGTHPYFGGPVADGDPWGVVPQAETFEQRMDAALGLASVFNGVYKDLFHYTLVDDLLDGSGGYNPTWSTYGATPNGGWIIAKDGTVKLAQRFISHAQPSADDTIEEGEAAMSKVMDALLGKEEL